MIRILGITTERLKSKKLKNILPEFYELEKIIEKVPFWHEKQSVFDHVIEVLENLEKIFQKVGKRVKRYLSQKVDFYSKRELLYLAAVFHDIAKPETIIEEDGITRCPDHEKKGAEKADFILKRFDISDKEREYIKKIIENHGILPSIMDEKEEGFIRRFEAFKKRFSDIFLELVILAMADTLGSDLKKTDKRELKRRVDFYKKILEKLDVTC